MIIGNGMMAKRFSPSYQHNRTTVIFASGVSNSSETSPAAFKREEELLLNCIRAYRDQSLVYFSTCSIFDPSLHQSAYIAHKLRMERIISQEAAHYLVCRTSNIVGHNGNPNTLINYLVNKIIREEEFDLWVHSFRNMLDIDDLYNCVHSLLGKPGMPKQTVNIACPFSYSIKEIVSILESYLQKKARYRVVDKGSHYSIPEIVEWNDGSPGMPSREYYLHNMMRKYHPIPQPVE